MITIRSLVAMGIGALIASTGGLAFALPYTPIIDEFWITKNAAGAAPDEIFRDSFGDGVVPPSGPDGTGTYFGVGFAGMTGESSGKLTMTPSLGDPTGLVGTFAEHSTVASRLLATNPANSNFLGEESAFSIHGLFDMSDLPMVTGQSFGIRATDRALLSGNEGDDTYVLFVGKSLMTSDIVVGLRHVDFGLDVSTLLDTVSIQAFLPTAGQIELVLSKEAGDDFLLASYILYDNSVTPGILDSGQIGSGLSIYMGEDYIRGGFQSTDIVPVPEPAILALLGLGFAGMAFARKRITHA